jgi:hypothetical protein
MIILTKCNLGSAMTQTVSCRPFTAEVRVGPRLSVWDLWWTKWHCDGFSPRVPRFSPVNFIPPVLHDTNKRKILIIFITGLHNKPQGCSAVVASAAGPFAAKNNSSLITENYLHLKYWSQIHSDDAHGSSWALYYTAIPGLPLLLRKELPHWPFKDET